MKRITLILFVLLLMYVSTTGCGAPQVESQPDTSGTQIALQELTQTALISKKTQESIQAATQTAAFSIAQTQTAIPRNCTPGQTYIDTEGDASNEYLDILKVDTSLDGDLLTIVLYLKNLPREIQIGRDEEGDYFQEICYEISIDVDDDPSTGSSFAIGRSVDYEILIPPSIASELKSYQLNEFPLDIVFIYESLEGGSFSILKQAKREINYELNTITFSGNIPGINENSRLYFSTNQQNPYFETIDLLCE